MTNKKANGRVVDDEWALSLPSQQALVNDSMQSYQIAVSRHRKLSKGEERVAAEGNKQLLVSAFEIQKGVLATQGNDKVHDLASESFFNLAMHHDEQIDKAAGTRVEKMLAQYAKYDLDAAARHNQKIAEVLNQKLIDIMAREVYVPDEPEIVVVEHERPPRNLLEKIFGG